MHKKDPYLSSVVFYENCQKQPLSPKVFACKAKTGDTKSIRVGMGWNVAAIKSVCCNAAFCDLTSLQDGLIHALRVARTGVAYKEMVLDHKKGY